MKSHFQMFQVKRWGVSFARMVFLLCFVFRSECWPRQMVDLNGNGMSDIWNGFIMRTALVQRRIQTVTAFQTFKRLCRNQSVQFQFLSLHSDRVLFGDKFFGDHGLRAGKTISVAKHRYAQPDELVC